MNRIAMEIVQLACDGERLIATNGPGEFTGEITVISGQQCLVRGGYKVAAIGRGSANATHAKKLGASVLHR